MDERRTSLKSSADGLGWVPAALRDIHLRF